MLKLPGRKKKLHQPEIKNVYSYFQAIYMSFYSSDLYADVGLRWKGFSIFYLVLVCCIASIPLVAKEYIVQKQNFDDKLIPLVKKIPPLKIIKGKISVDVPLPYTINEVGTDTPYIIIKEKVTPEFIDSTPAKIIVSKDAIYSKVLVSDKPQKNEFSDKDTGIITPEQLIVLYSKIKFYLLFLLYPIISMIAFGTSVVSLLVLSYLMCFFCKVVLRFSVKFQVSARLMFVASTPQLFLFFIAYALNLTGYTVSLLLFTVLMLYYFFGLRSFKMNMKQMVVV